VRVVQEGISNLYQRKSLLRAVHSMLIDSLGGAHRGEDRPIRYSGEILDGRAFLEG